MDLLFFAEELLLLHDPMDLKSKIHLQEGISYMDIGKIINHLSSRLRSRSQAVHAKLRIENAQGKILNFILVESALHPVYQKDIEKEFSHHITQSSLS